MLQGNSCLHIFSRKIFRINLSKWLYSRRKLLALQNLVQCEVHRELVLRGLRLGREEA
jgi:hypothetical protein